MCNRLCHPHRLIFLLRRRVHSKCVGEFSGIRIFRDLQETREQIREQ